MTNQRTIKFRFWNEKQNKFTYLSYLTLFEIGDCGWALNNSKNTKVSQFTGLKDKNGKEIYESDLIDYGVGMLEVIFKDGAFGYKNIEEDFCLLGNHNKDVEVIGNIYENKERFRKLENWEKEEMH